MHWARLFTTVAALSFIACGSSKDTPSKKATNGDVVTGDTDVGGDPAPGDSNTGPVCGNNQVEQGEDCDGTNLAGANCASVGNFASGTLSCVACTFNTSACVAASCGNDSREGTEVCDGADLGGSSCAQQGFGGGTLMCNASCNGYDTSSCTTEAAECGNGVIEGVEICDNDALDGANCATFGLGSGDLSCEADCRNFDTSACEVQASACSGPAGYRAGGINTGLADGEPCNYDSDCTNGCNGSFYCGAEGVSPATHAGDLPLGVACDANESCASGYCYQGGSSWICAEPCAVPAPGGTEVLNCRTPEEGVAAPEGAPGACIPGPGAGKTGDACVAGEFDCESGACLNEEFCTNVCDPTDPSTCEEGSSCAFLSAGAFGDIYICVTDERIAAGANAGEGDDCSGTFDCQAGQVCLEDGCTTLCPNGDECPDGTFCADDIEGSELCVSEDTRAELGGACDFDSQCPDATVCYDAGGGSTCHATCPEGTCEDSSATCAQAETGPALDTVIAVIDAVDATEAVAENDDLDNGYFSEVSLDLQAGSHTFWLLVAPYQGSPAGEYRVEAFIDGVPATDTIAEVEPNDTAETAQEIAALPATVVAEFVNSPDAEDVDFYKYTFTLDAAATVTMRTDRTTSGICTVEPSLLADGAACTSSESCENECFPFTRNGDSFCASTCAATEDCAEGQTCTSFNDSTPAQGFCFNAGDVATETRAFGAECDGPHQCASGMCLKHRFDDTYRCGAECEGAADSACGSDAGVCSATNPIYGDACVPHLGGTRTPGQDCSWDADCSGDNKCVADQCQGEDVATRYEPTGGVVTGGACNIDSDCAAGNTCIAALCLPADTTGCEEGNGVLDPGEVCDPDLAVTVTCADLGAGEGTVTCGPNCAGYDISDCSGLPNGTPCNYDEECAGGHCFAGSNTWFCTDACTDEADTASCAATEVYGDATSCTQSYLGDFGCAPNPGVGAPGDPCRSGFLDCGSGICFDGAFCIDTCTLENPDTCGRSAACVSYETDLMVDTYIEVFSTGDTNTALASNDDNAFNPDLDRIDLFSTVRFTNEGSSAANYYVKVTASEAFSADFVAGSSDTGDYQLQAFTSAAPPPFGGTALENELREGAPRNDAAADAQPIDDLVPQRVDAFLDVADTDYFRVTVGAGEELTAATTWGLDQVCWPNTRLGVADGSECTYDFECQGGACNDSICATECTGGKQCEVGNSCGSTLADGARSFCYRNLEFGDDCTDAAVDTAGTSTPVCPDGVCLVINDSIRCGSDCLTDEVGTGCGNFADGLFDGECALAGDDYVCAPHQGRTATEGAECLLDADCASNCCAGAQGEGVCSASEGNCQRDSN